MRLRAACAVVAALAAASAGPVAGESQGRRVGEGGITVDLPAGWHTWQRLQGLTPAVPEPLTRVVAVSAPFRFDERGCQVAANSFSPAAVAAVVVEWTKGSPGNGWAPRPRRFSAAVLGLRPPPAIECFDGRGGSVEFVDHGTRLGAYLLAGRRAPTALVARARAVLDILRVGPR